MVGGKQPHISYPYNPIIAEVLFKTTFLENWGSGAGRIMDACKAQNVEVPTGPRRAVLLSSHSNDLQRKLSPKLGSKRIQVRPKYDTSTVQVQTLIKSMSEDYMTTKEMIEACGLKSRMRFVEYYINPALSDGVIERKYPDQPNHPRQQYRLTEKAIEWKKSK
jgi:ATP-dependent DNA helicase RecG